MEYCKMSSDKFFYRNLVTQISSGAARRSNEKEISEEPKQSSNSSLGIA